MPPPNLPRHPAAAYRGGKLLTSPLRIELTITLGQLVGQALGSHATDDGTALLARL
ncbi:hypothetical protein [Brenneria rubrifaciens]|uniref:hypothetical protein n=1 Tax=Brenneria rubrifaciens TaxID=55213 RepID=UPI001585D9E3|nr:hypothetical protein [Brenneria rubrifaciens]